jgi:hypothetical protein
MEAKGNTSRVLVEELEENKPYRRYMRRLKGNIKMDLKGIGW